MDPIGNREPTSPYGLIRRAQKVADAGALELIDGAVQGTAAALGAGGGPPTSPVQAPPRAGSTIHVVA